jgi:Fur family transcriptional regulator, ferric uptake regulator
MVRANKEIEPNKTFRRNTQQRREIRQIFESNDRPLAADEILRLAQERVAGLGMATVYRTIKGLAAEGWLVPVEVPGAPPRYEMRGKAHHHHFRCLKCGKLYELQACFEHLGKMVPPAFRLVNHVVIIEGFCAACERKKKTTHNGRAASLANSKG